MGTGGGCTPIFERLTLGEEITEAFGSIYITVYAVMDIFPIPKLKFYIKKPKSSLTRRLRNVALE